MGNIIRSILSAPNALLRGLAERFLIGWLRKAAEGTGFLARAIQWAKGAKTLTGVILGFGVWVAAGDWGLPTGWIAGLGSLSAVLIGAGLADKALHQPGRPDILAGNAWYLALADNAGLLASALLAGFGYVAGPSCIALEVRTLSLSCAGQGNILLGLALGLVYLGVLDQGFLSRVPKRG